MSCKVALQADPVFAFYTLESGNAQAKKLWGLYKHMPSHTVVMAILPIIHLAIQKSTSPITKSYIDHNQASSMTYQQQNGLYVQHFRDIS